MRTIAGLSACVIMLICAYAAPSPLYGQDAQDEKSRTYAFSTWTRLGVLAGHAEEIVYPTNTKAELLSQLLWDMKPVFYYGLSLDFSQVQPKTQWGFFSTLSLKNGIPGKSGKIEDRDWMSTENTALTDYSIHDNYTNSLFLLDLSIGLSFPIRRILLLKPHLSLSYMHFSFSGRYGHGNYPYPIGPVDYGDWEKVINYTQDWLSVSPGVSVGYYFLNYFYAELFFNISPWIKCNDLDEHLTTNNRADRYSSFRDYMRGGLLVEPGLHFSWLINKRLELSLDFSWRHIGGTKGKTWGAVTVGSADYIQIGEAGAGLSLTDTGLCLKVRL